MLSASCFWFLAPWSIWILYPTISGDTHNGLIAMYGVSLHSFKNSLNQITDTRSYVVFLRKLVRYYQREEFAVYPLDHYELTDADRQMFFDAIKQLHYYLEEE